MTTARFPRGPVRNAAGAWLASLSLALLSACGGGGDSAGAGATGGDASDCLNATQLTTTGNTESTTFTIRNGSGATAGTMTVARTVLGPATFNGQSVINTRNTTTTTPTGGASEVDIDVSHDRLSGLTLLNDGTTTEARPGVPSTQTVNTPAEAFRFDLKEGESATQTVVTVLDGNSSTANTRTLRWTYVGREDLTVPAGTFRQACRFSSRETDTASTEVSTANYWLASGSGVLLKVDAQVSDAGSTVIAVSELQTATQNGRAVTP